MLDEEHRSSDGSLTLVVSREDGDVTIGFLGYTWHTHGDLLVEKRPIGEAEGLTPETAAARFIGDVIAGRAVIAVLRIGREIRDVWVTDDMASELKYIGADEALEFRYWDGSVVGWTAGSRGSLPDDEHGECCVSAVVREVFFDGRHLPAPTGNVGRRPAGGARRTR